MVTTATTTAKEKVRLKKVEDMTPEEKAAYDKKTDAHKEEYLGKLQLQDAQDVIAKSREKQAKEREDKKAKSDMEKGVKDIIKDVRAGTLTADMESVLPRFVALKVPEDDRSALLERVKTDSISRRTSESLPAKPAYELTHSLVRVSKDQLIKPEGLASADSTLTNSLRRYGMILPMVVRETTEEGKYRIMDGQRRYTTIADGGSVEVLVVAGFPDEDTAERAEVTLNRVRSLNVVAVSNSLNRMRLRGIADTEIRRDMGFKTGEIDKLTSVQTNLIPALKDALMEGNITPSVALNIAKLNKTLQEGLATLYAKRKTENANLARISENDVEQVRQSRAADAAKRDTPTLSGLAGAVTNPEDAAGLDTSKKPSVESNAKTPAKGKAK